MLSSNAVLWNIGRMEKYALDDFMFCRRSGVNTKWRGTTS